MIITHNSSKMICIYSSMNFGQILISPSETAPEEETIAVEETAEETAPVEE